MGPQSNGTLHPEVSAKPARRRLSADFKQSILNQAAELEAKGCGVGELLRQNGLYRAQLADWRRAFAEHGSAGLVTQKAGRKAKTTASSKSDRQKLERQVASLSRKLAQAEAIIAIQKKVAALLTMPDDENES